MECLLVFWNILMTTSVLQTFLFEIDEVGILSHNHHTK